MLQIMKEMWRLVFALALDFGKMKNEGDETYINCKVLAMQFSKIGKA